MDSIKRGLLRQPSLFLAKSQRICYTDAKGVLREMDLQELREIYDAYAEAAEKVCREASFFAGAFGTGDDPRNHYCHVAFYEKVEKWCAEYAAAQPAPENAAEAVRFIVEAAGRDREKPIWWFCCAAQKHVLPLIPLLREADAADILESFRSLYPKMDWTPVQQQLEKALVQRSGEVPAIRENKTGLWIRRVIALLIGLTIAHLGVTLFLLADLGSDPFNVLIQGLFRIQPLAITHGTVHVAVSLLIIVVLLIVDKSYVRIGTFLCMILGGPIIDMFTWLLGGIVNNGSPMVVRILAVVLGCGILAFGMTIVIQSQAGTGPNDLVAVVISDKRRWKFGTVRIAVDVSFALLGFLLGGTVGVGTIICAAVVGPVAQVFMPLSQKLCRAFTDEKV